jgi:hypothetical protein
MHISLNVKVKYNRDEMICGYTTCKAFLLVSEAVVIDVAKGSATFGTSKVPAKIRSSKPEIFVGEQLQLRRE